jgi:hypothetical protein
MFAEFGQNPVSLDLDFETYEDSWKHVAIFRGGSGWLLTAKATIQSEFDLLRETLVVACDDRGNAYPVWRARHLTQCSWSNLDYCYEEPPEILDDLLCEEEGAFYARWQRAMNADLALLHEKSQRSLDALEERFRSQTKTVESQIADLRRRRRLALSSVDARLALSAIISDLEAESEQALGWYMDQRSALRREAEAVEEALWQRSDVLIEIETLFIARWRDACPAPESRPARTWRAGTYYAPAVPVDEPEPEAVDAVLAKVAAAMRTKAQKEADAAKNVTPEVPIDISQLPKSSPLRRRLKELKNEVKCPAQVEALAKPLLEPHSEPDQSHFQSEQLFVSKPCEDLAHKRAMLLAELEDLVETGRKFFAGSRKFIRNRDLRTALEKKLALLDQRIAAAQGSQAQVSRAGQPKKEAEEPWTDKRVELLKRLWVAGHSAGRIADALGSTSRNAVIGKAKRLGLPFKILSSTETTD